MKREGDKIQTIVKTYTQNGEGSERRRKKAVRWGGKCKEKKKSIKKSLPERVDLVSQKDEM